jgi:cystathionine gamma-synthase
MRIVNDASWRRQTWAVVGGRPDVEPDAPLSVPIVASATYVAGGPTGYARYGNPTWEALEAAVARLDGGSAVAFASGMAAVSAAVQVLLADAPPGASVVVPRTGYHTSLQLLGRLGRPVRPVDITDTPQVAAALYGAALLWVESPTNPMLDVADLPVLTAAARAARVPVAVDATVATPLLLRPLEQGADLVVHAATKYLSGHSDALLGLVVTADPALADEVRTHRGMHGAVPGPFEAWLVLRGLRTLPVRMDRAQRSAGELARRLAGHPQVTRVRYPGLPGTAGYATAQRTLDGPGALLAIEVAGGPAAADAVCAATRLWVHATSLGGVESLLERRRRWPAESPDVPENLVRLSVGLEDVDDLWADLDAALGATRA